MIDNELAAILQLCIVRAHEAGVIDDDERNFALDGLDRLEGLNAA